jgi:hypothetical protein
VGSRASEEGAGMKMSLQCLLRSVGSIIPFVVVCIQSGHVLSCHRGIAADNESHCRRGGVSEVLASRMLYRLL